MCATTTSGHSPCCVLYDAPTGYYDFKKRATRRKSLVIRKYLFSVSKLAGVSLKTALNCCNINIMWTIVGILVQCLRVTASTKCGTFVPGGACSPNTRYVNLLDKGNAADCIDACEAQPVGGCCWHRPNDVGPGICQWVAGGRMVHFGQPGVRESTECTGPPVPPGSPEQVHISFGAKVGSMVVQWAVAMNSVSIENITALGPVLTYWPNGEKSRATKLLPVYTSVGPGAYAQFRVQLSGLRPSASYTYTVGWLNPPVNGSSLMTLPATFDVPPAEEVDLLHYSPRLVMFGDLGWTDDQILPFLRQECAAGAVDAIVIFGDVRV